MKKLIVIPVILLLIISTALLGCEAEPDNGNGAENGADNGDNGAQVGNGREDGTFSAASEADDRGYVHADVTFEDDEITEVELAEFNDKGIEKGEDYDWDPFHEAMDELPERFKEANDSDIEVYTEATGTSEKAMGAVDKAIQRAEGETGAFDGTFLGTSEQTDDGWGVAWVTLDNEEISEVKLEEVTLTDEEDEEYEFKDDDYQWEEWHEAKEAMPDWFVEENSSEVDVYTDATESSEMWMEAVEDALQKAGREEEAGEGETEDEEEVGEEENGEE
ncbi:hypothetical protein [Natranaerofaba carboxydovora]|uniref:FMN-binding protein n=1 Tax=Natranaerofaba carboxydovora TaxID=2742683 RepID=UPI001F143771|nr:hypothetical protein [Natranaerofaba carboxydovora]UMZ74167.1 FMN-binding domain protein [Natranaerofaba carboxydovora]